MDDQLDSNYRRISDSYYRQWAIAYLKYLGKGEGEMYWGQMHILVSRQINNVATRFAPRLRLENIFLITIITKIVRISE